MKNHFLPIVGFAIAASVLTGCDQKAKLAENLSGTWTSAPEMLSNNVGTQSSLIKVLEFTPVNGEAGGSVIVSGLVSVTSEVPQTNGFVQPISYSASAVATIQGTWTAHDDDEIYLFLQPSTLSINVDTSAVELNYNVLTGNSAPDAITLKPEIAEKIKKEVSSQIQASFFNISKIDDIKIKGGILNCEINHRDITLRKQTAQ